MLRSIAFEWKKGFNDFVLTEISVPFICKRSLPLALFRHKDITLKGFLYNENGKHHSDSSASLTKDTKITLVFFEKDAGVWLSFVGRLRQRFLSKVIWEYIFVITLKTYSIGYNQRSILNWPDLSQGLKWATESKLGTNLLNIGKPRSLSSPNPVLFPIHWVRQWTCFWRITADTSKFIIYNQGSDNSASISKEILWTWFYEHYHIS